MSSKTKELIEGVLVGAFWLAVIVAFYILFTVNARSEGAQHCNAVVDIQALYTADKEEAYGIRFDTDTSATITHVLTELFGPPDAAVTEVWAVFDTDKDSNSGLFLYGAGCFVNYVPMSGDDMSSLFDAIGLAAPDKPDFHTGGNRGQSI